MAFRDDTWSANKKWKHAHCPLCHKENTNQNHKKKQFTRWDGCSQRDRWYSVDVDGRSWSLVQWWEHKTEQTLWNSPVIMPSIKQDIPCDPVVLLLVHIQEKWRCRAPTKTVLKCSEKPYSWSTSGHDPKSLSTEERYPQNDLSLYNKKGWRTNTCYNLDELQKHMKLKRLITKTVDCMIPFI